MAQKTNFNVNPYFDDFAEKNLGAKDKNYHSYQNHHNKD